MNFEWEQISGRLGIRRADDSVTFQIGHSPHQKSGAGSISIFKNEARPLASALLAWAGDPPLPRVVLAQWTAELRQLLEDRPNWTILQEIVAGLEAILAAIPEAEKALPHSQIAECLDSLDNLWRRSWVAGNTEKDDWLGDFYRFRDCLHRSASAKAAGVFPVATVADTSGTSDAPLPRARLAQLVGKLADLNIDGYPVVPGPIIRDLKRLLAETPAETAMPKPSPPLSRAWLATFVERMCHLRAVWTTSTTRDLQFANLLADAEEVLEAWTAMEGVLEATPNADGQSLPEADLIRLRDTLPLTEEPEPKRVKAPENHVEVCEPQTLEYWRRQYDKEHEALEELAHGVCSLCESLEVPCRDSYNQALTDARSVVHSLRASLVRARYDLASAINQLMTEGGLGTIFEALGRPDAEPQSVEKACELAREALHDSEWSRVSTRESDCRAFFRALGMAPEQRPTIQRCCEQARQFRAERDNARKALAEQLQSTIRADDTQAQEQLTEAKRAAGKAKLLPRTRLAELVERFRNVLPLSHTYASDFYRELNALCIEFEALLAATPAGPVPNPSVDTAGLDRLIERLGRAVQDCFEPSQAQTVWNALEDALRGLRGEEASRCSTSS